VNLARARRASTTARVNANSPPAARAYWRVFWLEESLAEAATACTAGSAAAFCRVSNTREMATTATTDATINPNVNSGPVTGLRRLALMTSSND
jgi:hypothetical protein